MSLAADYIIKILTLGDTTVGKTSIILRYTDLIFDKRVVATIGVDFKNKIKILANNKKAKLVIWDTAGQERFRNLTRNYYNGTDCALLVFDITNKKTFDIIPHWVEELEKRRNLQETCLVLVGNKKDLSKSREVFPEDLIPIQNKYHCKYFEVSALTNEGIEGLFDYAVEETINIINLKEKNDDENNNNDSFRQYKKIKHMKNKQNKDKCC